MNRKICSRFQEDSSVAPAWQCVNLDRFRRPFLLEIKISRLQIGLSQLVSQRFASTYPLILTR